MYGPTEFASAASVAKRMEYASKNDDVVDFKQEATSNDIATESLPHTVQSDIDIAANYAALEVQTIAQELAVSTLRDISSTKSVSESTPGDCTQSESDTSSGEEDSDAQSANDEKIPDGTAKIAAEIEARLKHEEEKPSVPIHTANEQIQLPVKEANIELTFHSAIIKCGKVLNICRTLYLITIQADVHSRPLNEDSVLCFEDRTLLGCIDEIFGPVTAPMYTVRFTSSDNVPECACVGMSVYYASDHTTFVEPQSLISKGSDASNLYDEESQQQDFSDDEQEAASKRTRKKRTRDARSGGTNTFTVGTYSRHHPPVLQRPRSNSDAHVMHTAYMQNGHTHMNQGYGGFEAAFQYEAQRNVNGPYYEQSPRVYTQMLQPYIPHHPGATIGFGSRFRQNSFSPYAAPRYEERQHNQAYMEPFPVRENAHRERYSSQLYQLPYPHPPNDPRRE